MTGKTCWFAILACAIALSGCDTVSSTRPLGLPVWSEMQGIWEVEGDIFEVRLLPDGSMSVASINWDKGERQFTLGKLELVISVDEGATYANIRDPDAPEGTEQYSFYRVLFLGTSTAGAGPDVLLISPNEDLFAEAITEGRLSGKDTEFGIVIDDPRLADFVDPLRFAEQFAVDHHESTVLARRIVNFNGPDIEATVLHQGQQAHMECLPEALAQRKRLGSDVRGALNRLKSELEQQLEHPIEMPDPAGEQWARLLNIDPEQWARLMAPLPPSEQRFDFVNNGIAITARLSAADFSSYLTCLDSRGFGLVNVSDDEYADFWVAKGGFGLFEFSVFMK